MSDHCEEVRDWRLYVQDMIEFGERVLSYTQGLDQEAFTADMRTYDAALCNIELIGEAATHVFVHVREAQPGDRMAAHRGNPEPCGPRVSGH